ncbi:MAG: EAL domain-containing protein [Dongiaceae bacterium]
MHKLIHRQLEQAKADNGAVDADRFAALVSAAYEDFDRDRRRTDRSISLMVEELDQLTRGLERLVSERTTALRVREAELEIQNRRFDAAINHMSQALQLFDRDGRLLICNQQYLDMYRLAEDAARPGTTLLDLLRAREKAGTLVGSPESVAAEVFSAAARGRVHTWLGALPDGRTVSVLVHPMSDGGWLTTHEDITERRDAEERIAHMARHDGLTDLPNRVLFLEELGNVLSHLAAKQRLAVLYLDLDKFKTVNDTLGHRIGDDLLVAVAARLAGCVRETDVVARVGGDEFAIVQTDVAGGGAEIAALATRICETIKAPYEIAGDIVIVETSIGISMGPDDANDAGDLLKNADLALYRAKAESRGSFRFFEPEMDARMKARRGLEVALRNALAAGEFRVVYQPVVNLESGRIASCEALIRWTHPELGEIAPEDFIPLAEEIGLIVPIGEWVLRRACADAMSWGDLRVAVNLSPLQLLHPSLVPMVVNALASAGLPASRLDVEITETVLMQNTATTLAALHRLRGLGIRISMDDFGTGYSSLSNLRSFPFDKIKIDRSFIHGLPDGEDSVAIVRAVAGLAKGLNMVTTAEGVETVAQMELVRRLGCTEMQGFYFSRPRTAEQLSLLLTGDAVRLAKIA